MAAVALGIRVTDAKERSLELAEARGETACSHHAKTLGWALDEAGSLVSVALEISSATSDLVYAVGYVAARDDAICECEAAQRHRPCWHRGLAILCGRQLRRIYSPAGRAAAKRALTLDLAAEGNLAALLPSL